MCPDEISISLSCLEFAELHGSVGKPLHQMREFLNDRSHRCFFCLFLLLSPLWNFSYIRTGTLRWGRRPLRLCAFLLSPLFYRGTNGWWPIFKSPEHSFHLQSAAESIHWIFFYFTYHASLCSMVTAHTFYSPLEVLYPLLCGGHCLPLNMFITGFFFLLNRYLDPLKVSFYWLPSFLRRCTTVLLLWRCMHFPLKTGYLNTMLE